MAAAWQTPFPLYRRLGTCKEYITNTDASYSQIPKVLSRKITWNLGPMAMLPRGNDPHKWPWLPFLKCIYERALGTSCWDPSFTRHRILLEELALQCIRDLIWPFALTGGVPRIIGWLTLKIKSVWQISIHYSFILKSIRWPLCLWHKWIIKTNIYQVNYNLVDIIWHVGSYKLAFRRKRQ